MSPFSSHCPFVSSTVVIFKIFSTQQCANCRPTNSIQYTFLMSLPLICLYLQKQNRFNKKRNISYKSLCVAIFVCLQTFKVVNHIDTPLVLYTFSVLTNESIMTHDELRKVIFPFFSRFETI
jgi:hypothetical protein